MRIVYLGTPQFAADVLKFLIDHDVMIEAVITRPDKPKKRSGTPQPSPVKEVAVNNNLTLYQPVKTSDDSFREVLDTLKADLFVVVAYGEILKEHVLAHPKYGCINLHASLLPKFRGAAPVHRAVMEGELQSGVTIMQLSREMDAGGILKQQIVTISENMTAGELMSALCDVGKEALLETIEQFDVMVPQSIEQDKALVTFAPKISTEECKINFLKPAKEVHNLIRGTSPAPGAWCEVEVQGKLRRLKVLRSECDETIEGQPGEILIYDHRGFWVGCLSGAVRFQMLQLEGKKIMEDVAFVKGVYCSII